MSNGAKNKEKKKDNRGGDRGSVYLHDQISGRKEMGKKILPKQKKKGGQVSENSAGKMTGGSV